MGGNPDTQVLAAEIDAEFSAELRREERTVEALLFALGRSVSVSEIATALNTGEKPARDAAERLCESYRERQGGILIERLEDRYQMCTNPSEFPALIRVAKQPKKPVLTDVVMETLAIIAYKQPITKAEIERIRGVKSDHAVNRLVEYELIYEAGRLDAPGRPALFATSEEFLRRFGVQSLAELPELSPEAEKAIETEVSEEIADVLGSDEQENAEEASTARNEPEEAETARGEFGQAENGAAAPEAVGEEEGRSPESEAQESDREEKAPETDKVEGSRETVPESDAVTEAEPQQREDGSSEEEWLEQLLYETALEEGEASVAEMSEELPPAEPETVYEPSEDGGSELDVPKVDGDSESDAPEAEEAKCSAAGQSLEEAGTEEEYPAEPETEEEKASAAPEEIPEEGSESTEDANAGSPES